MIDIHTHVIPFVDDGSKSLEDSISMIKHEIEIGVDTIIACAGCSGPYGRALPRGF